MKKEQKSNTTSGCCGGKGKSWLMLLGCLLPLIALFTLPLFGVKSAYFTWIAFLACPLMMLYMMHNMKEKEQCH